MSGRRAVARALFVSVCVAIGAALGTAVAFIAAALVLGVATRVGEGIWGLMGVVALGGAALGAWAGGALAWHTSRGWGQRTGGV